MQTLHPRYQARSTGRLRSPVSRLHARSLYSYQQYFHAVRAKKVAVLFMYYHTRTTFQDRFHAITRDVSYDTHPDSSIILKADSVGVNRPRPITRREDLLALLYAARSLTNLQTRSGRAQSFSSSSHGDTTCTRCYMQPGRRRIGTAVWHGEIVSCRYVHGASTSDKTPRT